MLKPILKIAAIMLLLIFASTTKADSFFDVFFDVEYDDASSSPVLMAKSRVITPGTETRSVETEMISMSLSSHNNGSGGSGHAATVHVRSWVPNSKGNISRIDSFFDVFYECSISDEKATTCGVTGTKAKLKYKHRGHVTVLK